MSKKAVQPTITMLNQDHPLFPSRLRSIPDSPTALYIGGTWAWLERIPCVAVIGTRYASEWGNNIAFSLASELSSLGWGIISGLALGIDTAAHKGALANSGLTGATLPGGLHRIYPPENVGLALDIMNSGGVMMSEYELGVESAVDNFKARDRLQSGLCSAVVVVETEPDGGTMHTAQFAVTQGKTLLVFSPPEGISANCEGNRILSTWPTAVTLPSLDAILETLLNPELLTDK